MPEPFSLSPLIPASDRGFRLEGYGLRARGGENVGPNRKGEKDDETDFPVVAFGGLVLNLVAPRLGAADVSALPTDGTVGWYGGDWQSGIPGVANRYTSAKDYSRVYDDFVVPEPGR